MSSKELLIGVPLQLFFILTPAAAIATLVSITRRMTMSDRVKIAVAAASVATIIIIFLAFLGPTFFALFHITPDSFRIAGGVYLMIMGLNLLNDDTDVSVDSGNLRKAKFSVAITPLAMPLLAGPGTISYICLVRSKLLTANELIQFLVGICCTMSFIAICLVGSVKMSDHIPKNAILIFQKLTGIMIVCIAVQAMCSALKAFY